jgi:hypothetical protein
MICKILILVMMLLSATSANGSLYDLEENRIWGFTKDTTYNALTGPVTDEDSLAVARFKEVESTITEYRYDSMDTSFLYLCGRYHFDDMPCIKLYHINCLIEPGNGTGFLFNSCDSSLCFFDGDVPRFSRVMQKYLPELIEQKRINELIDFYFYINWQGEHCQILSTPSDFEALWDKYWLPLVKLDNPEFDSLNIMMYSQEKVRKDIEIDSVKHWNLGTNIINGVNEFKITIWTWQESGNLIKWDFIISTREFGLIGKKIMGRKMGPPVIFHD